MKILTVLFIPLFVCSGTIQAQESFTFNGSTIVYNAPDSAKWRAVKNEVDEKSGKYLLMFKRTPIKDKEDREIEPVMAIICEPVTDNSDIAKYSALKRTQMPLDVKKLLAPQQNDFAYKNAVGYEAVYGKGLIHKVLIGHLRNKNVGARVICDSTESVYDKVEADMRKFIKSINFKD